MPNRRLPAGQRSSGGSFHDESKTVHTHGTSGARSGIAQRGNRRRSPSRGMSGWTAMLIVVLLAAAGGYAGYIYRSSEALRNYLPIALRGASVATAFPDVHTMNVMVIGRDYDYNNQDQILKSGARSDMLMVARIDLDNRTAQLLSIPRDTEAQIPGHGITKINAAHAYGGPPLAAQTITANMGIPIDHYVALDFDGFSKAIDLLGGVNCTVDKKMDYDDNWGHLHIHLLPGLQHLDGEQAMEFVRFRHSDSDLVRIERQQQLLAQLKRKLVQPATLAVLPSLLDTIDKHVTSDMTDNQKLALANFFHGLPQQNVQMTVLPSITSRSSVQTDYAKAAPVIKQIFGVEMPERITASGDRDHVRHARYRRRRADVT